MLPIALRVSRASVRGMMGPPVSAWSGLWREGPEIRGASSMEARPSSSSSTTDSATKASTTSWNDEWARVGLGAHKADAGVETLNRLLFVQTGFGCDQHGDREVKGATTAAVRACRNAIEFNSIPGIIEAVPGGRKNMIVHVKLGVPSEYHVDVNEVAKVFPYGKLLPIDTVAGGLTYGCGRVVPELGDLDDTAIVVCAAVSIGYHQAEEVPSAAGHKTWDTRDGH
mmetsp:Transcript_47695/g.121698  ORF Transcript_47695/g.121698 Transcript_47695/m.121698 type:complete len:226 (-) Transcript_47695:164-841(-)